METYQITKTIPNYSEVKKLTDAGATISGVRYIEELDKNGKTNKFYEITHTPVKTKGESK
jgi:hypothetical protein